MKFSLTYERQYGQMTITEGAREFTVWHSRVLSSMALDALAEAVINLLSGLDRGICAWEEEPGQYRWVLVREGEQVQITILWFRDSFSTLPDERGEVVFSALCPLRRFAVQVKNVLLGEIDAGAQGRYLATTLAKLDAQLQRQRDASGQG